MLLAWGACPHALFAQANRPGRIEDPFRRFRDAPPEPAPLLPMEAAWQLTLPAVPSAPAAMDAHRVYIPLRDPRIIAIDRDTGTLVWTRTIYSSLPPLVAGGLVYVVQGAALRALDAESGADRWATVLDAPPVAPLGHAGHLVLSVVAPGELVAIDGASGAVLWRRSVGSATLHAPVAHGDTAYLTTVDSRVFAIALETGEIVWDVTLPGILSPPAVAGDRVFVGSTDNSLYAFDAANGALRWRWRIGGGDVIGAATDAGMVYMASLDNIIRALNQGNGNQRWKEDTETRPLFPPIAVGGLVVVPGVAPAARVFNGRTGAALGSITLTQGSLLGAPLVDAALPAFRPVVFLLTREGTLEAYRSVPLMFRETAPTPATALPGRVVPREVLR